MPYCDNSGGNTCRSMYHSELVRSKCINFNIYHWNRNRVRIRYVLMGKRWFLRSETYKNVTPLFRTDLSAGYRERHHVLWKISIVSNWHCSMWGWIRYLHLCSANWNPNFKLFMAAGDVGHCWYRVYVHYIRIIVPAPETHSKKWQ